MELKLLKMNSVAETDTDGELRKKKEERRRERNWENMGEKGGLNLILCNIEKIED